MCLTYTPCKKYAILEARKPFLVNSSVLLVVKHDVKNKILDTLVNRFYTRSTEHDYP
nr:MAG TPA: hypothetical protein [Caudoviricetes sp.]